MAINLEKGQRISLEKSNGSKLQNICVGINWGAIEKRAYSSAAKRSG
jgi:tellurium resistance protein TerZ